MAKSATKLREAIKLAKKEEHAASKEVQAAQKALVRAQAKEDKWATKLGNLESDLQDMNEEGLD
jgi:hypothetical protein